MMSDQEEIGDQAVGPTIVDPEFQMNWFIKEVVRIEMEKKTLEMEKKTLESGLSDMSKHMEKMGNWMFKTSQEIASMKESIGQVASMKESIDQLKLMHDDHGRMIREILVGQAPPVGGQNIDGDTKGATSGGTTDAILGSTSGTPRGPSEEEEAGATYGASG